MADKTVLILHRKSANDSLSKDAIKKAGLDLRVLVPRNKSEKPRVVKEGLERGATRVIAGGGFDAHRRRSWTTDSWTS